MGTTRGHDLKTALLAVVLVSFSGLAVAAPVPEKDQDRIVPGAGLPMGKDSDSLLPRVPRGGEGTSPLQPEGEAPEGAPMQEPPEFQYETPASEEPDLEELIDEDIPDLRAVELSEDSAKRALDAFAEVFGKFDDEEIARYPTLQEFAEKSPQGKKFAEIIRKHGFESVKEWNDVISNIGFAYTSIEEGHDDEVFRRISKVEARKDMPKERKERLLAYLRALVPSINNRKVVQRLLTDPVYREKLYLLEGGSGEE